MSIVLLLLFALSVVYTGLRATWERGPEHDFLKAKPNDREQLVPGVLGMFLLVAWFWEVPSSSDAWWYLLLALLLLWFALFMLCALGAALIHPEQLGLSSRHARSPTAAFPAREGSTPRGPSILLFLAGAALFLALFAELLPDEAIELRHNVAIGLLLVMAASGVMLGWVLFRPWLIIRQYPNQEGAQAFCLLAMMLFFHAALLVVPAEREGRLAVFGCGVLLLCAAPPLRLVRWVTGGAHGPGRQMSAVTLYLLCIPVCLMTGVMLVPDVPAQEPLPSMAVQHAAMTRQEAQQQREQQRALVASVPPAPARSTAPAESMIAAPAPDGTAAGRRTLEPKPETESGAKSGPGVAVPVAGGARGTSARPSVDAAEPPLETRLAQIVRERIRDLITDVPDVRVTRNDRGTFRIEMRPGVFCYQPEDGDVIGRVAEKLHDSLRAVAAEGVRMHAVEMHEGEGPLRQPVRKAGAIAVAARPGSVAHQLAGDRQGASARSGAGEMAAGWSGGGQGVLPEA